MEEKERDDCFEKTGCNGGLDTSEKNDEREYREIFDTISKRYHKVTNSHFYNAFIEVPATLSLLKNIKGKKVLDLGCGTGRHTSEMKNMGAEVWGLDISSKMLEIAKKEVQEVDFRLGSAYRLPYKSGFFDIVLAGLVVHYFEDLDRAFGEVYRVLKKNGTFVFSISNPIFNVSDTMQGKPKNYRIFGDYFEEGKMYLKWHTLKMKMPIYHKTMQTFVRTINRNRFVLEDLVEAKAVEESKKFFPDRYRVYSRIPYFYVFRVRKLSPKKKLGDYCP